MTESTPMISESFDRELLNLPEKADPMQLIQAAIHLLDDANFLEDRAEFARRGSILAHRIQTLLDNTPSLSDQAQAKARTFIMTITQLTDASAYPLHIRLGRQAEASMDTLLQETKILREQLQIYIDHYQEADDILTKLEATIRYFQITHEDAKARGEPWLPTQKNNSDRDSFLGIVACVDELSKCGLQDQKLKTFTENAMNRLSSVGLEHEKTITMRQQIRALAGREEHDLDTHLTPPAQGN